MEIFIDNKAKVPLFAVFASLPFIVGFMLWLTSVASDASIAKSEVTDLKKLVLETRDTVVRIDQQLKDRRVK